MKVTCLLFLAMGCAALMPGTSYAAPSQQESAASSASTVSDRSHDDPPHKAEHAASADGKGQKEENPSDEQPYGRQASGKNHSRSRAILTAANRPKQPPNRRKRSLPENAMNLGQPGSDNSSGAAKGRLVQNEAVNNALPVRPPSVVRLTGPPLNNLRHRGPNPAVVGGSANSYSRNSGAINGTRMNRKP